MNIKRNTTISFSNLSPLNKIFRISTIIVVAIMLATLITTTQWDTDTLWEIAEGREILENGVPYIDTFRILPDMSIVVQQWLYDIFIALFDNLHTIGHILAQTINLIIVFGVGYLYLSQYKIKFEYKIIALTLLLIITQYPIVARPEGITVTLLTLECYAFERYNTTKKWQWLLILPISMLFETNFHMSMIWFHFLIALVYFVPSFCHKLYLTYMETLKFPLLFTLSMIPIMFINPYGINGVLYLPISYLSGTFSYIYAEELTPNILQIILILSLAIIVYVFTYLKKEKPFNYQIYLFIGCFILIIFAQRNVMFMYIAFLCISSLFLENISSKNTHLKICITIGILSLLGILFSVRFTQSIIFSISLDFSSEKATAETIVSIYPYLGESLSESDAYIRTKTNINDINLFAGADTGAYFEYLGYKNVYMDARPELRMKAINKQRDELPEYQYFAYNIDCLYPENFTEDFINEIKNWFNEYNFDYIFVANYTEITLATYMEYYDEDYTPVVYGEWGALYEKN